MITMQAAANAIANFIVRDMSPLMSSNLRKFGAIFTANALRANPKQVIGQYIQFLQMLGIVSDDATMVDVDLLENSLMQTFNDVPIITIFGIDVDSAGARMLINHLRNA